jgi:UPF0042 nucleotide-binding protein
MKHIVENDRVEFIIITGLSGAGRTESLHAFEDLGYFCIDNLPPALIPKVAELVALPGSGNNKVALVTDVRGGQFFDALWEALRELKDMRIEYRILFLDASTSMIVKRFKETRRRHPLAKGGDIVEGVNRERALLEDIKEEADMLIDTTDLSSQELRQTVSAGFLPGTFNTALSITVMSFGYKYGLPVDADIVLDVRFLPNPYYNETLRNLTGLNKKVRDFVMSQTTTQTFLKKAESLLSFLLPRYAKEGKTHFTIALGCTGGRHRSVVMTEELFKYLSDKKFNVITRHRDIDRDVKPPGPRP